jgi:hypothetical protein
MSKQSFFKRHPKKGAAILMFGIMAFLFVVTEFTLQKMGMKPGNIGNSAFFTTVDSLVEYEGYEADEDGVMHVNADMAEFLSFHIKQQKKFTPTEEWDLIQDKDSRIFKLVNQYTALNTGELDNDFSRFITDLKSKNSVDLSETDEAYLTYCHQPINSHGYRSIEFKNYKTDKTKVLLLGDSFTWGRSAENVTSSFADNLAAKDYVVFNTGIITGDPMQYLAAAQKFIPILKPDIVIVNFYFGNDLMYFNRKPEPYQMPYYFTNSGLLNGNPMGKYLSLNDAYQINLDLFEIPTSNSIFNRMCSKTVITTKLWQVLNKIFDLDKNSVLSRYSKTTKGMAGSEPISDQSLLAIKNICRSEGSQFILAGIEIGPHKKMKPIDYQTLFDSLEFHIPSTITADDYLIDDPHYNDAGHRKYADFLDELIRTSSRN